MLMLHRAFAAPYHQRQAAHEVAVFFEADPSEESVPVKLLRLLTMAWACPPADIDFHGLVCDADMLAESTLPAAAGDVRWLQIGLIERPVFCTPDATLMLVRPDTLQRLQRAMEHARVWHTFGDARWELLHRTLPHLPRMRGAIERGLRRAEDQAAAEMRAMARGR